MSQYDLVVIGAGPGGHAAAMHAAGLGASVAVVEKGDWGGTCANVGCIPTKALLVCSQKYAELQNLKRLGIGLENPAFDFPAMKKHQQAQVRVSNRGVQKSLQEAGVNLIAGEGKLIEPGKVQVLEEAGTSDLEAENIIIAWGSEPFVLPGVELSVKILTSDGILALEQLPHSLAIIGGGVIGVEFATFLAELGVEVTIIELLDQIVPYEDEEVAAFLQKQLERIGIKVLTSTKMEKILETQEGVEIAVSNADGESVIKADKAAICIGRKPVLYHDQLDSVGIEYERGIKVDKNNQTNVKGIYAIGDVTGGIMLAHGASQQGKAVADKLFGNGDVKYNSDYVPSVVYTHPQIARVGVLEKDALEQGWDIDVKRSEFGANALARAELAGQGFVKAIFEGDQLLGVTIVGPDACELINPLSLAIVNKLTKKDLLNWIIPHPTLSEVFLELLA